MRIMNSMIKLAELKPGTVIRSFKKHWHNFLLLPLLLSVFIISCEEDPTMIGHDVLPGSDFDSIAAIDTMSIAMYTRYDDSLSSMFPAISYLGSITDPYFGLTEADFVSQLWLDREWMDDGLLSIDSMVLGLHIRGVNGESELGGMLNMYELDEMMSPDSTYLINRDVPVKGLMASVVIPPLAAGDIDTTVFVDLPLSFAEYVLRDTASLYLRSDSADFRNYFNGLYFDSEDDRRMLEVDFVSENTMMVIYYTSADSIPRSYRLLINNRCVRYNLYEHDFEQAEAGKRIKYINEPVKDSLAYAQSKFGVYTKLVLPGLEDFRSEMSAEISASRVAVNKARLYLPVFIDPENYNEDMIPSNLLVRYDSAGVKRNLSDYLLSPQFLDGSYDIISNRYEVNIASFVQRYLEGEVTEPAIEIFVPQQSSKNLIMKANRGPGEGARFELTYTLLNEE